MKKICTCLIPTFNEGEKLIETVDKLKKVKEIDDFLIVDDGSTDNSLNMLRIRFPNIRILKFSSNKGKSDAVRESLKKINSEYILLFDADLKNIRPEEFSEGLKKSFKIFPEPSMVIFRRMKSPIMPKLVRSDILLTGERLIKTEILKKAMNRKPIPHKYQMEAAINQYCVDKNENVYWYPVSTKNTFKIYKLGIIRGLLGDLTTFVKEATKVGTLNYIRQILFFCRNELQ